MQACRLGDEQTCFGPVCDRVLALTETTSNGLLTVVSAAVAEGAGAPLPPGAWRAASLALFHLYGRMSCEDTRSACHV